MQSLFATRNVWDLGWAWAPAWGRLMHHSVAPISASRNARTRRGGVRGCSSARQWSANAPYFCWPRKTRQRRSRLRGFWGQDLPPTSFVFGPGTVPLWRFRLRTECEPERVRNCIFDARPYRRGAFRAAKPYRRGAFISQTVPEGGL